MVPMLATQTLVDRQRFAFWVSLVELFIIKFLTLEGNIILGDNSIRTFEQTAQSARIYVCNIFKS